MTALKPIENRRVRGVPSERYPLNEKCAHPECSEPVADPHHTFPRSLIGNDSWFVDIQLGDEPGQSLVGHGLEPIPHVSGLCRTHHDDVEEHRAWIRLEDGVFVWYDFLGDVRADLGAGKLNITDFKKVGPLNPQPGSREGKPKRRKFKGEARRKRRVISIAVPQDEQEDGAGLLEDALTAAEEKITGVLFESGDQRPPYYTIMDALNKVILDA